MIRTNDSSVPASPRPAPPIDRRWVVVLALGVLLAATAAGVREATAEPPPPPQCAAPTGIDGGGERWHHPVDAPIVDGFRPPAGPYGPGNRGLEYGTGSGDRVSAVAAGIVTFAGPVGRSRFVVVQHPSGIRSTSAYLSHIDTAVGAAVSRGQTIATSEPGFHLTARRGDTYIDPLLLMIDGCSFVKLVPVPPVDQRSPLPPVAPVD